MGEDENKKRERRHQEDLERLRGFRPIDDTFMRGSNSHEKLQDHSCRNGICGAVDCGIAFTAS